VVRVPDIVAFILDFEERDQLIGVRDIADAFGIDEQEVAVALSSYGGDLERLRPLAHARRRVAPDPWR
jgi:hypothetical protein